MLDKIGCGSWLAFRMALSCLRPPRPSQSLRTCHTNWACHTNWTCHSNWACHSNSAQVVLWSLCLTLAMTLSAAAQPAVEGQWSSVFDTVNVMIHATVLPNGKVLFWGRREAGQEINPPAPRDCQPRLWDPSMGTGTSAFSVTLNKPGFNLFCSGHAMLADGRLFVVGGHIADGKGEKHATLYDPATNRWTGIADTSGGRWYPTAVTLADGGVLVSFGTDEHGNDNTTQQVWKDGTWRTIVNFNVPPYYPRLHVVADGRVFMSGPLALTQFLDTGGAGQWNPLSNRINQLRDYAPSVLYDKNKILFVGGGDRPTAKAETLDLNQAMPTWTATDPMHFRRRQHNATLLADGSVLVTGGTKGAGFNNLTPGQPLRSAEVWNPVTKHWTKLAKSSVNRCYHSVAVLLPDATVLSAGGGEYSPNNDGLPNPPQDTLPNAQVFSPPYLFKGTRPAITSAPSVIDYGATFDVGTSNPSQIDHVNWVRLCSVTHSIDMNQRFVRLNFNVSAGMLNVTAPATSKECPPGHYMMFLVNNQGVPSVAKIVRIR